MTNYERLEFELNGKDYFSTKFNDTHYVYNQILEENGLDPYEEYSKENNQISMLESVYTILQMLSNDIDMFRKVETEFATTSAAYQYLQKRLKDLRTEIDRIKLETHYTDSTGNVSSITSYMFFNGRKEGE